MQAGAGFSGASVVGHRSGQPGRGCSTLVGRKREGLQRYIGGASAQGMTLRSCCAGGGTVTEPGTVRGIMLFVGLHQALLSSVVRVHHRHLRGQYDRRGLRATCP